MSFLSDLADTLRWLCVFAAIGAFATAGALGWLLYRLVLLILPS